MAGRIRSIKPELLEDEKASALSDAAWRLFVSSWLLADDHGRFRAGARYLAAQVWQDTSLTEKASAALAELAAVGRVNVYQVDGQAYAEIPTWNKHQRIDNAGRPRVPPPPSCDSDNLDAVSPRTAETRGDSPRFAARASELAARPPTTTTTTTSEGDDSAARPPPPAPVQLDAQPEEPKRAKGDRKRPARAMPDGWKPNAKHLERARELGFGDRETLAMGESFAEYHRSKGNVFADWDAAFGTWIRKEAKYRAERGERVGGPAIPLPDRPASGTRIAAPPPMPIAARGEP